MKLSEELQARGYIAQCTSDNLSEIFDEEKRVIYHGIDPTADSAHAGNFVIWMLLKHLVNHGHQIVFLIGGGTGMIGDPKPDAERELSPREVIVGRVEKIKKQASDFFGQTKVTFVDNHDWLGDLSLITFLRDIGKHFTVGELLKKEAIARRLQSEVGLSYTEFAYPLLQAYDYLELYQKSNVTVQVGGSDQWGNVVAGVDLVRRKTQTTVYGLTVPLIIDKTTGKKFGKSEGNAVWLDATKTAPYAFYQFWLNTSDESVGEYLKLFSLLSLEEISHLAEAVATKPQERLAQKTLAAEVTKLVHGVEASDQVKRVTELLFGNESITALTEVDRQFLLVNAPQQNFAPGTELIKALVAAGLASSKREAKTFVTEGAVTINGTKILEVDSCLDYDAQTILQVKRGKKNIALFLIK